MNEITLRPKQDTEILQAANDPKPQKVEVKRRFVDEKISWQERSAMMAQQQGLFFGTPLQQQARQQARQQAQYSIFSPYGSPLEDLFGRIT